MTEVKWWMKCQYSISKITRSIKFDTYAHTQRKWEFESSHHPNRYQQEFNWKNPQNHAVHVNRKYQPQMVSMNRVESMKNSKFHRRLPMIPRVKFTFTNAVFHHKMIWLVAAEAIDFFSNSLNAYKNILTWPLLLSIFYKHFCCSCIALYSYPF